MSVIDGNTAELFPDMDTDNSLLVAQPISPRPRSAIDTANTRTYSVNLIAKLFSNIPVILGEASTVRFVSLFLGIFINVKIFSVTTYQFAISLHAVLGETAVSLLMRIFWKRHSLPRLQSFAINKDCE